MIDRKVFYEAIRDELFHNLSQLHVDGLNDLLDEWHGHRSDDDPRWLAYVLATAYHETGHTMLPIEEWGRGRGHLYGIPDVETKACYFGRGFCQLTWRANYKKASELTGYDLINHPELALDPSIAAKIICEGMEQGWFTGKKLPDYFNDEVYDPINARRIINGSDKADLIATYYRSFANALARAKQSDAITPYPNTKSNARPVYQWWRSWTL